MGIVTKPFTFANGTTADALEVNANFDTLYSVVNGNLNTENFESQGVETSDIADDSVSFSKINWGTGADQIDGTETTRWKISKGAGSELIITHAALTGSRTWSHPDVSDTYVGLDAVQTLTNKTLTAPILNSAVLDAPTISSFVNANHSHLHGPGGGTLDTAAIATGVFPVSRGGTDISSYTIGDLLYGSGTLILSKLAAVATGNVLISGGVATAPSWGKVGLTTHVSGTLPTANGGTGVTSSTGSGNNVLSASPTFTGTVVIPGCTMSGTWSGSPTFSGNPTFSGTPVFSGNPSFTGNPSFADEIDLPYIDPPTAGGYANANSLVKAWIKLRLTGTGTVVLDATFDDYNITSVTMTGSTIMTVNIDTNMANANYVVIITTGEFSGFTPAMDWYVASQAVGSFTIESASGSGIASSGSGDYIDYHIAVIGEQ